MLAALMMTMFFALPAAHAWAGGMMSYQECARNCKSSYQECKKKETTESVINDISCVELLEMCQLECRNREDYLNCKRECGDDTDCLASCKEGFMENVPDYRPYLNRKQKN
jgi:hypothetical protein